MQKVWEKVYQLVTTPHLYIVVAGVAGILAKDPTIHFPHILNDISMSAVLISGLMVQWANKNPVS